MGCSCLPPKHCPHAAAGRPATLCSFAVAGISLGLVYRSPSKRPTWTNETETLTRASFALAVMASGWGSQGKVRDAPHPSPDESCFAPLVKEGQVGVSHNA